MQRRSSEGGGSDGEGVGDVGPQRNDEGAEEGHEGGSGSGSNFSFGNIFFLPGTLETAAAGIFCIGIGRGPSAVASSKSGSIGSIGIGMQGEELLRRSCCGGPPAGCFFTARAGRFFTARDVRGVGATLPRATQAMDACFSGCQPAPFRRPAV